MLAAPVPALEGLARRAVAAASDDCLVTDLGSAKAALLGALTPGERERFIGGHPVCGAERTGVAFARATCSAAPPGSSPPAPRRGRTCSSAFTAWWGRSAPARWRSTRGSTTA